MTEVLKYQSLIDNQNLAIPCPHNCKPIKSIAYRWTKEDFTDGQSFLPNLIYDENRGKKPRKNDPGDAIKCEMCALSFFDSIQSSLLNAEAMGGTSKVIKLLGYTHISEGTLQTIDGIGNSVDEEGHFLFFEFENINLESQFKVIQSL